jgi:hypothetical protein
MSTLMTIIFLAGVALVAYGAWLAWPPAGFVVAGAALAWIAVSYERGDAR